MKTTTLIIVIIIVTMATYAQSPLDTLVPKIDTYYYTIPEVHDDGWLTASATSVGLDSSYFENLINDLNNHEGHLVHGITIIRNGLLVFEHYFDGYTHPTWGEIPVSYDWDVMHVLSSVTKSFTSTLLGIAIEQGFISNVDVKVFDFYPELQYLNIGLKDEITLQHLVTQSSGLEWNEQSVPLTNPDNDLTMLINLALNTNENLAAFILGKDLIDIPGEVFLYGGGNYNLLGDIIHRASGLLLDEFANEYLINPLGINDSWWWRLRPDFVYASGDNALRPRDMAKFGQLFLQNGNWNGQQIVSEDWLTLCSTPYFNLTAPWWGYLHGHSGYSYGWWTKTENYGQGAFTACGWGGQGIIILPEYDMVVVFTGGSYWEPPYLTDHQMMMQYILPSIQNSTSIDNNNDQTSGLDSNLEIYPNPFQYSTTIKYYLHKDSNVKIKIIDNTGKEIKILTDSYQTPGTYSIDWDGTDNFGQTVPSGVYYCIIQTETELKTIKMIKYH